MSGKGGGAAREEVGDAACERGADLGEPKRFLRRPERPLACLGAGRFAVGMVDSGEWRLLLVRRGLNVGSHSRTCCVPQRVQVVLVGDVSGVAARQAWMQVVR